MTEKNMKKTYEALLKYMGDNAGSWLDDVKVAYNDFCGNREMSLEKHKQLLLFYCNMYTSCKTDKKYFLSILEK